MNDQEREELKHEVLELQDKYRNQQITVDEYKELETKYILLQWNISPKFVKSVFSKLTVERREKPD